jgi:hypothetical protein
MFDHEAIFKVACRLRPLYDGQQNWHNQLLYDADVDVVKANAYWIAACHLYSDNLLFYSRIVAEATGSNIDNIRMMFRKHPEPTHIVWTPDDLLQAACHESFNMRHWKETSLALTRVPKNHYEFPK